MKGMTFHKRLQVPQPCNLLETLGAYYRFICCISFYDDIIGQSQSFRQGQEVQRITEMPMVIDSISSGRCVRRSA